MRSSNVSTRNFSSSFEIGPRRQLDPRRGEGGGHLVEEADLEPGQEQLDAVADVEELPSRGAPVGAEGRHFASHLVLQRRHPDLEELVEVLAEDGEELRPLQQGDPLVLGQGQDPLVEVEPGQLAIAVADRGLVPHGRDLVGSSGHAAIVPAGGRGGPAWLVNVW